MTTTPFFFIELDAAIVGLGLTYTLTLAGSLQYCIRLSGDVENVVGVTTLMGLLSQSFIPPPYKMMSAERVSQYSRLLPEEPLNQTSLPACSDLPPEWPQSGEITLEDVSFRYSPRSPLVLKSISCHIMPAEKVCSKPYLELMYLAVIVIHLSPCSPFNIIIAIHLLTHN